MSAPRAAGSLREYMGQKRHIAPGACSEAGEGRAPPLPRELSEPTADVAYAARTRRAKP